MGFLFCCFLLQLLMALTECCVCMPTHPQSAFCKADFAFRAQIISKRYFQYAKDWKTFEALGLDLRIPYYKILITKVFKGQKKIKQLANNTSAILPDFFKTVLHIQGDNGMSCNTKLQKGQKYLITGRILNGKIHLSHCDWKLEWHQLTKKMKAGIFGDYDCGCKVSTCIDGFCDHDGPCKWSSTWDKPIDECTAKHLACRKTVNQCKWIHNSEYKECAVTIT